MTKVATAGMRRTRHGRRRHDLPALTVPGAVLVLVVVALALPAAATAEQASEPSSAAAAQLDAGGRHTCSLDGGDVRCWGLGFSGQLGYANKDSIGDNETPGAAGPVSFGPGRFATAVSAGEFHTCAVLDDGSVRCWGFGGDGRLGYGNENDVGDDESPGAVGPVNLGAGRTARAISAGGAHSCAVLDTGGVLCWGFGEDGRLGYGDPASVGDDEAPGSLAPVDLGPGRTAIAISAGAQHTCALLDDASVRCWGTNGTVFGGDGRLGYGNADTIGDDETPGSVGPVDLGADATAISAGDFHTCAVLAGGGVRCWGNGVDGRLGYGDEGAIGDYETPATVAPVDLGGPAAAITAGNHTCARLASGAVRCWGPGALGRLGYANTNDIGDDESPGSVQPVVTGGLATAVSAGGTHTCARLADATLRCWGEAGFGRLGYGNDSDIGDDETPAAAGPVNLKAPVVAIAPPANPAVGRLPGPVVPPPAPPAPVVDPLDESLRLQARRSADLRACRASAARRMRTARSAARRRYRQPRVRDHVLRLIAKTAGQRRKQCLRRFGRVPARVATLVVGGTARSSIVLRFDAPGTDGSKAPAAKGYIVKQSLRPIRTTRDFDRAMTLCGGVCRFGVTRPGDAVTLTINRLRRRTTYYYAVAARDNVSARRGPRSKTVSAKTR